MKNFSGAVVVTGATSGIGEACALFLDKLGFQVFAGVIADIDGEKLKAKSSNLLTPVLMDVTNLQSIAAAFDIVANNVKNSGIVGLINNAGVGYGAPLELIPIGDLREQFEVNVIGQIAVTQKFLPLLRHGRGRIINIGSISGLFAAPLAGPYCASKYAMEALTDSLREELQPWGISVTIVEPGVVNTGIWGKMEAKAREYFQSLSPEEHLLYDDTLNAYFKLMETVTKRSMSPEVVAKAVARELTAKRPKTRCTIGIDAKATAMFIIPLPDRLKDLIITKAAGVPKKNSYIHK